MKKSGKSRYQIAKETGLEQATLCRFANGQTAMNIANAQLLAGAVGLEIVIRPKGRGKGR